MAGPNSGSFFDSLANLLSIGFSLTEALKFIAETDHQLARGVGRIIASLKSGNDFSEGVRPLIETQAYHQLLIAEKHGQLSEILNELAKFDRLRLKQLKKIKAMLIYPLFLCCILGVLILMIRLYVFHRFASLCRMSARTINRLGISGFSNGCRCQLSSV